MRIFITTLATAISGLLFFSADVTAECQASQNLPSQQLFVPFSLNSHEVTESEKIRIERWVSEINSKHPIQNWIYIIGSASKNETAPAQLATKRASEVTKTVIDDGLISAPFQIKTQIYPINSATESTSATREVTVQVSPGCLDNCCTDH
ncbi:TPA: OmpA family protein [Burkholderia stabilis]|nr:OmpA family protein [Burkholderia stabilis]HDR9648278.1 OmpA family protein [Burkholderia stabilis]HDR9655800.1 OmpA family protein [Burkholderia stabilis]HDR9679125.1 OmpA family protein [Burkholderia stabilis]